MYIRGSCGSVSSISSPVCIGPSCIQDRKDKQESGNGWGLQGIDPTGSDYGEGWGRELGL